MIVFFGLGNNEEKYLQTKHNIGRLLVEEITAKKFSQSNWVKGENYLFSKYRISDKSAYFLLSLRYMNTSGSVLTSFVNYYKLNSADLRLVVFQDDSDQLEGRKKLVSGGGSAGHRGIDDIYRHLLGLRVSPEQVWRLKIGIRPPGNRLKSETFVLKKINQGDKQTIAKLAESVANNLSLFISADLDKLQNIINS
jgi:peptidyl-tRNA hydrolase, PTH1 family